MKTYEELVLLTLIARLRASRAMTEEQIAIEAYDHAINNFNPGSKSDVDKVFTKAAPPVAALPDDDPKLPKKR